MVPGRTYRTSGHPAQGTIFAFSHKSRLIRHYGRPALPARLAAGYRVATGNNMPRPLRLHVPGGFYHVTLRGNHRQDVFRTPADRGLLDEIVAAAIRDLGVRMHAYCWMTNHIHLLVQVSDTPHGKFVLRIASRYARKFQECMETTGHLFERRHHAILVDADSYLLAL